MSADTKEELEARVGQLVVRLETDIKKLNEKHPVTAGLLEAFQRELKDLAKELAEAKVLEEVARLETGLASMVENLEEYLTKLEAGDN